MSFLHISNVIFINFTFLWNAIKEMLALMAFLYVFFYSEKTFRNAKIIIYHCYWNILINLFYKNFIAPKLNPHNLINLFSKYVGFFYYRIYVLCPFLINLYSNPTVRLPEVGRNIIWDFSGVSDKKIPCTRCINISDY